jgi:O-antigen/teichoic acid export membrane protein
MINKINKIKDLIVKFKGLTTMSSALVVSQLISGIFWLYIARLLGTELYGELSYYIAIASIASTISLLGAGNTILTYTAKGIKIQPPIFLITISSSIITSIIVFFMFYNVGVSLFVVASVIFVLTTNELLGFKLFKKYSFYIIIQKIMAVGLAIGLFYIIGFNGIILGISLSFFPSMIRLYQVFRKSKIDFSILKSRGGFMINSYMLDISKTFNGSIDKIIIAPFLGFALLGNYHLGIQILMILTLIPSTIYGYIATHDASGNPNKRLKFYTILFSVGLSIAGVVLSPIVLPSLFPKFNEAIVVIQILSLSIVPGTINLTYISKFMGNEKPKIVLIGSVMFILIHVVGILTLGKLYSVNGVAISFVLAVTSEMAYLFFMNKFIKIKK